MTKNKMIWAVLCGVLAASFAASAQDEDASHARACAAALAQDLARHLTLSDYPEYLQNNDTQGTVLVRVAVDRTGKLAGSSLAQTSGSEPLDDAALRAVDRIFPPTSPAPGACGQGAASSVTLPLRFRVEVTPYEH